MVELQAFSWIILIFVAIFLIWLLYIVFSATAKRGNPDNVYETGKRGDPGVCPVCGTILKKGESLKSALYPGEKDRLCYIYGCPHCYPHCKAHLTRQCPVCKEPLSQENHLIARYFERIDESKRVHIVGCPKCRYS